MSRYQHAPGLFSDDRKDTYFALLPAELITLLNYYYFFPVQIILYQHNFIDSNTTIYVSRVNGPSSTELIELTINLTDLIKFLKPADGRLRTYKILQNDATRSDTTRIIFDDIYLEIIFSSTKSKVHIDYDKYVTMVLIEKLNFLQRELVKYDRQNLHMLNEKLLRYAY